MASEAAVRVLFSLGCPASLLAGLWLRGTRAAAIALRLIRTNTGGIQGPAAEGCDYPGVTRQGSHAKRLIQLPSESGLPLSVTPSNSSTNPAQDALALVSKLAICVKSNDANVLFNSSSIKVTLIVLFLTGLFVCLFVWSAGRLMAALAAVCG
jgi:hypothetical protein